MAKFIKSIFHSSGPEKSKSIRHDSEIEGEGDSPIGDRRKLSMSRSGRLKHHYRKRHSLSVELYRKDDDIPSIEKPKSMEYHVHPQNPLPQSPDRKKSVESTRNGSKSPDEEIDNAFEIIDKS